MLNKLIVLTAVLIVFQPSGFSQPESDRWSLSYNIGVTNGVAPYAPGYWSNTLGFMHTNIGGRFMFNNKFGIKADFGYDRIKNDEFGDNGQSLPFRSNYFRYSLQLTANLGRTLNFEDFTDHFGLLLHGGMGYSSNQKKGAPLFGESNSPDRDNMVNFIVGFTPQYKLSDRFAVNADVSFVHHIYQQRTWDLSAPYNDRGFDGFMANATVGVTYYFGKGTHMDWTFDPKPPSTDEVAEAVMNKLDAEALFDQLPDSDDDGIPDRLDACPNTAGEIAHNGCPDDNASNKNLEDDSLNTSENDSLPYEIGTDKSGLDPVEVEVELFDFHELHVVVGMFKERKNAINYVEKLKNEGHDAEIVGISKGFSIVSVGSFDEITEARRRLMRAREDIIETAWMMKKMRDYE
ncbi:MAG: SPOR domain-containing protein [Bacteroidota bacterium]